MTTKTITQHAATAKAIKQELKTIELKNQAKVRSSAFSGGTSVDVFLTDETPQIFQLVEQVIAKYQYGHFDGMNDCYYDSNTNNSIPQVMFVSASNKPTQYRNRQLLNI
jgi:hypothetical protein